MSFALSDFRVSKPLELNSHDNQGVLFLLYDLDEGLGWEESVARDEARKALLIEPGGRVMAITVYEKKALLRGVKLFSQLSEEDLERVANLVKIDGPYPSGSIVCEEGEIGTRFYIIYSGELRGFTSEERLREEWGRTLKEGDAFGETSLLAGEPRDATVEAIEEAELLYIEKAEFSRLISDYPNIPNRLVMRGDIAMRLKAPSFRWQEEGENTIWFSRKHWYVFVRSIFRSVLVWLLVGLVLLITLLRLSNFFDLPSTTIAMIVLIPSLLLLVAAWIWLYAYWLNDYFVLTNRRIVHVEVIQFFYQRREEARLDKIQDVDVSIEFIGGLLGFGHIRVDTAGLWAESVTFSYIPAPEMVKEQIFAQRRHVQVRSSREARADIRGELLRELGLVESMRPEESLPQDTTVPAKADRTIWRKHWIILLQKMALPLSLSLISGLAWVFAMETTGETFNLPFALPFLFLLSLIVSFLWCAWEFYLWNNDLYIVDENSIIKSKRIPILGQQETSLSSLALIQKVTMTVPSWWSSLVKLGHVTIKTARAEFDFHNVYDPDAVNEEILRRRDAAWGRTMAEQMLREYPLAGEAERFLTQAGFGVQYADPFGLLCTSHLPLWANTSPLYVRLVLERELDLDEFQDLCRAAEGTYGGDLRGRTVAVVIDLPPSEGDLYQIFALRAQRGLTVVPLSGPLMVRARVDESEKETLKERIELYTGRTDLYNAQAVIDSLSFFGRSGLLANLQRQMLSGRSAVIFGVRKVGKTWLLDGLRDKCPWPVALINLQGYVGKVGYIYEEALRGWRASMETTSGLMLPEWTDDLAALDLAAHQARVFLRAMVDLLNLLADQRGQPGLLLFLDEIDVLFHQPEYLEFARILRSTAEDPRCRGRFALLGAGYEPTLNRVDWIDGERNPFYAFFSEMAVGPLGLEDARRMVLSIGGQMGISYEAEALDLLVKAGGGHPFLTRQLCSQAVRDLRRPGTVDLGRATWAVEDYLRLARNYFAESLWGIDSGGPPPAEAALLRSLAATRPQPEMGLILPSLSSKERRARHLALDHLRDQSLIRHVEGGWELTIPLYRRWIRRYILNLSDEAAEGGDR